MTLGRNHVCKRICLRVDGLLASPLLVGSGKCHETDMDVILDAYGRPFVPGSSLAGALREYLTVVAGKAKADELFGVLESGRQSRIIVYDAELKDYRLSVRDGVKLDLYKTAEDQAKYDVQVVEAGAGYTIRLELVLRENDLRDSADAPGEAGYLELLPIMCRGLKKHEIRLGAKTNRGFGKLLVDNIFVKTFDLRDEKKCCEWLDWDWTQETAFMDAQPLDVGDTPLRYHCLRVPLEVEQSIIIRKYAAIGTGSCCEPDYEHLLSSGKPVIPGSSWMGAIRSRIKLILEDLGYIGPEDGKILEPIFGTWVSGDKKADLQASLVSVEESVIEGGSGLPMTRNAIDRFTGGTVPHVLETKIGKSVAVSNKKGIETI